MKKIIKSLFLGAFCMASIVCEGQLESVDLLMKYNCETDEYDVSMIVVEGSAMSIPERAQFNAQISLVVPTGENVVITERYMPIQNNQAYDGTEPMDWGIGNPTYSPAAMPQSDFYAVLPKLAPASFYNDLVEGDVVPLFSFTAGDSGQYDEEVRFYINGVDPDDEAPGMNGADYSIGMTVGSPEAIFNNSSVESCITSTQTIEKLEVDVFPNPFEHQLALGLPHDIKKVVVYGADGKIYFQTSRIADTRLAIDSHDFPKGIYYVKVESAHDITSQKVVKY